MPKRKRAQSIRRSMALTPRAARRHARRSLKRSSRGGDGVLDGKIVGDKSVAFQESSAAKPTRRASMRATFVSILIGSSVSLLTVGLVARLGPLLGQRPTPEKTVVATVLLLISLGIMIPHQVAMWVSMSAWKRFFSQGRPLGASGPLDARDVDPSRNWILLAVVSLGAGVATALTPVVARGVTGSYGWLQDHFVWSLAPLVLLRALVVVVTGLVPLTIIGVAISTAHRLNGPLGVWDTRASAWLLVGAALGTWSSGVIGLAVRFPDLCLTAAALPALAACLIAAASCSPGITASLREHVSEASLPLWSDRWPTLLRASIVAVSAVGAWVICLRSRPVAEGEFAYPALAGMLAAAGVGILFGCSSREKKTRSIGGFGVACCFAGIVLALGLVSSGRGGADENLFQKAIGCLGVGAVGFAAAYGRQSLLMRVSPRSSAGSVMLVRVLVGCAFVVWLCAPAVGPLFSRYPAQAGSALFLLALGGTLIVHEPVSSLRTRVIRVGAVFCAIALMIGLTLFPLR